MENIGKKLVEKQRFIMESLHEKQCNGQYLVKYSKNGNLLRTAE